VDEYLSDNEQVERHRTWWRENGWFVIGGVALGFLALFGWRQYGEYQNSQAEAAAALYSQVKQATEVKNEVEAATLLGRLRSEHASSAYTPQAGLLVATSLLVAAPERAAEELRHVMEESDDDPELAMIARLRLARVLAYREQYDEALTLLTVNEPGQFAGRLNEVKGDIQAALGRVDEARAAYLAAMVADGSELLDRNFVQMKLNDLPGAAGAPPAENAPPAEGAPPAEDAPPAASSSAAPTLAPTPADTAPAPADTPTPAATAAPGAAAPANGGEGA
jgi:predicted negative regulator of RcsB-dependent stress response